MRNLIIAAALSAAAVLVPAVASAQDTAPADFERQLDRLLDDLEGLRRP